MNVYGLYDEIDDKIDSPDFEAGRFTHWLVGRIAEVLGRELQPEEMEIICVAFYAGALRGAKDVVHKVKPKLSGIH